MTLWLILGAMCAAVIAVLLMGLRRGRRNAAEAGEPHLAVYRAQLHELERDRERGVLAEAELADARLEVQRRLLTADAARRGTREDGTAAGQTASSRTRLGWALPAVLVVAVPAAAVSLYLWLGSPEARRADGGAPARTASGGSEDPAATRAEVEAMLARLRERLAEAPDDVEGWVRLGRISAILGRFDQAIEAYDRALALDAGRAEVHAALGEAHVMAAGGVVTEAARTAFERAVEADAENPRARFYLALARAQDGDERGALDDLAALLADAPPSAPWIDGVRREAVRLAEALELDPQSVLPPAGAADAEREAIAEMSPEEQDAAIRGMVGRLAARLEDEPDDAEGWRMLGRSYTALGETDQALAAYRRAAGLLPEDTGAQLDYAVALLEAAEPGTPPPAEAVERLEAIIAREPDNGDALYYLGEAARRGGDRAEAVAYWRRLLAQLPPDSKAHTWLKERIDALQPTE